MKIILALLAFISSSLAHQTSVSFLTIKETSAQLEGRWEIALKDLHYALDLDLNRDDAITWGELRAARDRIDAEAHRTLRISGSSIVIRDHRIQEHLGSSYLVLDWTAALPSGAVKIDYNFLFDIDPTHRVFLNFGNSTTVLTSDSHSFEAASARNGFFKEGVWHIWMGFDHVLFLLALLLPSVIAQKTLAPILREVAKVVTAFTLAHSITLSLAAMGLILIPAQIVEPIIGFSVLLAAVNNLRPMWRERGWMIAFGFGLIHGFGFAGVLNEIGLPSASLAKCLLLFNLGVEAGQLAIVALFIPIAFALRESWFYRGVVFRFGSAVISCIAAVWVVERLAH